jgi:hypothetical protein
LGNQNDKSLGEFIYKKFNWIEREENNNMKTNLGFDFGTCEYDNVKISMYGLAVKNTAGVYVSYNPTSKEIVDVDIMNFEGGKFLFKMPVALKDVQPGDVILHNRKPIIVTEAGEHDILGVDVVAGENKSVIPTRNMFGFNFITKIVSIFDSFGEAPTPDAPFGNMLPFMFLNNDGEDINPFLMCMMMQSNTEFNMPMMMYCLCQNKGNMEELMPLMFMANMKK